VVGVARAARHEADEEQELHGCKLRTTGLPETIPDTGDAVADLGTGFGESMTREEIIGGMQEQTILKWLATLDELGKVATFVASDQASTMTSTFANITCGAFLD
jgi:3-oxoacyl-[acyl-carrier protein] reductase